MKKIAILQSNYIPWKGYFDIIGMVDEFIFHDDLQFTKGDWRNRNKIKTAKGLEWLTIPCGTDEKRLICEVELKDHKWQQEHFNKLTQSYKNSRNYHFVSELLSRMYLERSWYNLSDFNQEVIKLISNEFLGIETKFLDSREFGLTKSKSERVLELCLKANATHYLSGPAAKNYIDIKSFENAGVTLEWMDYSNYPEYDQLHGKFEHGVTILDLLFSEGSNSINFLKCKKANINLLN